MILEANEIKEYKKLPKILKRKDSLRKRERWGDSERKRMRVKVSKSEVDR